MKIEITSELRTKIPYFEFINEDEVDVPDMPFINEVINKKEIPNDIESLEKVIYTSSYFNLPTEKYINDLIWLAGKNEETFLKYFISSNDTKWKVNNKLEHPLKGELLFYYPNEYISEEINMRYELNKLNINKIVEIGNLQLLKYMHENKNECLWNACTLRLAAENGHLDCLKYLHENGCPWDIWAIIRATEKGQIDCLKYLYENGCPRDKWLPNDAARNGQLECLKYLHENGCTLDKWLFNDAAENGQLECLKYLYENGCTLDKDVIVEAEKNGHTECLKYLHRNLSLAL